MDRAEARDTSRAGHVQSCLNMGGPPSSLSTPQRPIANKYREGKVKSTPTRGVKQFLKPGAYKQSKRASVTAYLLYYGSAT